MSWATIWVWFNAASSLITFFAVIMHIKVTNNGYKLRDEYIEFQDSFIRAQNLHIEYLQEQFKILLEERKVNDSL